MGHFFQQFAHIVNL